jgi:hypothetical protein
MLVLKSLLDAFVCFWFFFRSCMKLNSVMMSNTLDTGHPLSHMVSPTLKLQTHYGASDMVTQTRVQPRHEPGHLTATFRQAFVAPKGGISGSARNAGPMRCMEKWASHGWPSRFFPSWCCW